MFKIIILEDLVYFKCGKSNHVLFECMQQKPHSNLSTSKLQQHENSNPHHIYLFS